MAQNKNALIRYKTIDKCLQNPHKKWTLQDLIEACSDALYEYEGRTINVSKRTVQLDIQLLRSDKLGYNAPIEVYERKYYKYTDPNFSITDIPITESDFDILGESVEILKQFKDFSLFNELGDIIKKLEDKIYSEKTKHYPIIHLEKNEKLKGLEHLDVLYQAILKKIVLQITYKSFKAKKAHSYVLHPYFLKEYNNRWFIVGFADKSLNRPLATLALDRIIQIDFDLQTAYIENKVNPDNYYENTIGVTVHEKRQLSETRLKIAASNAPYVLTKPFHSSQNLIKTYEDGSIEISLLVDFNYEFERLILGFGNHIEVLAPRRLKQRIKKIHKQAYEVYLKKV